MIGIVGKRDPLSDVIKGTNRIEKAIDDLASRYPRSSKSPNSDAHQLTPLRNILKDMQQLIGNISLERKVKRVISPIDAAPGGSELRSGTWTRRPLRMSIWKSWNSGALIFPWTGRTHRRCQE